MKCGSNLNTSHYKDDSLDLSSQCSGDFLAYVLDKVFLKETTIDKYLDPSVIPYVDTH